jgi:class 3 adenylate cyclase/CHASE2 domain-containing sensor protein
MPRFALFAGILLLGGVAGALGLATPLDLKLLDVQFRWLRAWAPQPVARDVVVVGVDEDTARRFPEPITLWHRHLGQFFAAMAQAKPAVLGIDIVLPDRGYEPVLPGSDKMLMRGLLDARRSYPLVLALTVDPAGTPRAIHPPFVTLAGPGGAGYALFPADGDGFVRRFDERLPGTSAPVPTLAGQMARHLKVESGAGFLDYWRGAPFSYVPFHRVLEWAGAGDEESLARAFRDKPVMVGMVFRFEDRLSTPVQLAGWEAEAPNTAGVLVHAQALRNLLNEGFIRRVPALAVGAACAAIALLWFVSAGTAAVALLLAGAVLLLGAGSTWLLTQGWHFPALAPALTAAMALGGRHGYDTLLKLRERRRMRASFGGYVSPPVMEEILAGRIHPEMGGSKRFVCVLFSDIRGYTTRSERMTPEEVIRFLNRYFERAVGLIHERGGAVTSFMGDGIMAVFGAPKPLDNPCREAFEAARAMLDHVTEINSRLRAEGEAAMDIGIGLHAGEAVIGHVGSAARHDYTAIGDVTNVASRLESMTKEARHHIVVSRVVAERLGEEAGLVLLGPLAIKGHSPVEAFGYERA